MRECMINKIEKLLNTKVPVFVFCISNGIAAIFTQNLGLPRFLFMIVTIAIALLISVVVFACIIMSWLIISYIKEIFTKVTTWVYKKPKILLVSLFLTSFLLNLWCLGFIYKIHKKVDKVEQDMYFFYDDLKRGRIAELQILDINFEKRLIRLENHIPNLGALPILDKNTTIGRYEEALESDMLGE